MEYAVVWHPESTNLGDDLRTLAAARLLPRVDRVLDARSLDQPLPDLPEGERVAALLSGAALADLSHWPPNQRIVPFFAGLHLSAEDAWGVPFTALDGAGLKCLAAHTPVSCRDQRTAGLLAGADVPHVVSGCVTLTLSRPAGVTAGEELYCVDVPEAVTEALRALVGADVVRIVTHQRTNDDLDYARRMNAAEALLRRYAGARLVVTKRLHCAMACLAIGTPVILLYNSAYEDIRRFAPMDGMMRTLAEEDFLRELHEHGLPTPPVPMDVAPWREKLRSAVASGLRWAETARLPLVPPEEAQRWRVARLTRMASAAAHKIRTLEEAQYQELRGKLGLVMQEEAVKAALEPLLAEPEVVRALTRVARRRALMDVPWYRRPVVARRFRRDRGESGALLEDARRQLSGLGWPEKKE